MHLGRPVVPEENMINAGWSNGVASNSIVPSAAADPCHLSRKSLNGMRDGGRSDDESGSGSLLSPTGQ